jgi:outer membrane protein TolC
MFKPTLSALALAAALSACSSLPGAGPAPSITLPTAFGPTGAHSASVRSDTPWWTAFGDPVLNRLVPLALEANLDIGQAAERLAQSRALAAQRRAELGPTGDLTVGGRAQQLSAWEAPGRSRNERRSESAQVGLGISWEVDLFGRLRGPAQAAALRSEA